jgi:hypothetical protein
MSSNQACPIISNVIMTKQEVEQVHSKKTAITAALLCMCFLAAGCSRKDEVFPELPGEAEASVPMSDTAPAETETKAVKT